MKSVDRFCFFVLMNILLITTRVKSGDFDFLDFATKAAFAGIGGTTSYQFTKPNIEKKLKFSSLSNEIKSLSQEKKMLYVSRAELIEEMSNLISQCQQTLS